MVQVNPGFSRLSAKRHNLKISKALIFNKWTESLIDPFGNHFCILQDSFKNYFFLFNSLFPLLVSKTCYIFLKYYLLIMRSTHHFEQPPFFICTSLPYSSPWLSWHYVVYTKESFWKVQQTTQACKANE